jgi:hypothetical protein
MDPFELGSPRYSVVVLIFNEAETLPELARRLAGVFDRLDGPRKRAVFEAKGASVGRDGFRAPELRSA